MTTFDFSPLYRSTVGFDRLADLLINANGSDNSQNGFPPYNIEVVEKDQYQITMAVAGFSEDQLNITSEQNTLTVTGAKPEKTKGRQYLHQGIAERAFERRFQLADHVRVTGAKLENGLLHVSLLRELPEAMKPQSIKIESSAGRLIESKTEKSKDQAA